MNWGPLDYNLERGVSEPPDEYHDPEYGYDSEDDYLPSESNDPYDGELGEEQELDYDDQAEDVQKLQEDDFK